MSRRRPTIDAHANAPAATSDGEEAMAAPLPGATGDLSNMTLGELAQYLDRAQRLVLSASSEMKSPLAVDEASGGEAVSAKDDDQGNDGDVHKLVALLSRL